jgi:ABC-type branched-subunit amino acid transport system substrate-binding protein
VTDEVNLFTELPDPRVTADEHPRGAVRVGLIAPVSGQLGLVGPVAVNCAVLGAVEVNDGEGILGRPVELVLIDGGRAPNLVADEVADLVRAGAVQALVGMHASDVRQAVARVVRAAVPYVYTPPYEGGERTPGLFLMGEVPDRQLRPVLDWFVAARRARRWFLLGNDYVWPRSTHSAARRYLRALGASVVGELLVPLGACDPEPLLDAVERTGADAVLLTLIGTDLVRFNRAFGESRLGSRVLRLGAALEENGLLGIGGDTTGELYAAMGYFGSVATEAGLGFVERYTHRFGPHAPVLSGHGEGCYDGVRLLAALTNRAGSLRTPDVDACADGTSIVGGRGRLTVRGRHVDQPVYLARADGLDFDVIASF